MCRMRFTLLSVVLLALIVSACAGGDTRSRDDSDFVELKILAFNDFHGSLEAPAEGPGGAAYLAAHLRRAAAVAEHSVVVSAGDLIGATPLISSLFHDEPAIEAANLLGLDFNAVGNHEFDDGKDELLRMQYGGSHPDDGEKDGRTFAGAAFRFLAANVLVEGSGDTLFPAYAIRRFGGIPVAFIGLTLEGTPSVVTASGVSGLAFLDEAETINALVREIRQQGIESIVVLIHQGGYPGDGGEDDCNDFQGPIVDIVAATDPAVDLFVTGHTHSVYLCRLDGRPVTSAGLGGRYYTDISARLDRRTGDLSVTGFDNVPVTADLAAADDVQALVDKYRGLVEAESGRVVGVISADVTKSANAAGESALGGLIADAQLAATRSPQQGDAQVAFMNAGGIRDNLLFRASGGERDGEVTYADLFAVHPFSNYLVTMTLTGAEIHALLEQQWLNQQSPNMLAPSRGFSYAWSEGRLAGTRVDPSSLTIDGAAVEPEASYRVTVNSFLAGGGDGFPVLREGRDPRNGMLDIDALERYLESHSPIQPQPLNRIQLLDGDSDRHREAP